MTHIRHRTAGLILFLSALALFGRDSIAQDVCRRGFEGADRILTAGNPASAVYADFDGDGRVDVAFTLPHQIAIALNRGGGVFQPAQRQPLPSSNPVLAAATDVDRDGRIDLLARHFNIIYVARGQGDGSFEPIARTTTLDSRLNRWRLSDFDRDGLLDFIDYGDDDVRLVRSNGDGTFAESARSRMTANDFLESRSYAVGDFDGDGRVDFVRAGYHSGTFRWIATFLWNAATNDESETGEIVAIDVNFGLGAVDSDADGIDEIVAGGPGGVALLRIHDQRIAIDTAPFARVGPFIPRFAVIADIDGDGWRDLIYGTGGSVARGVGPDLYGEPVHFVLPRATGFALADIDGDGGKDVVTTGGDHGLHVLYGRTLFSTLPPVQRYPLDFVVGAVHVADVDRDGMADVIATASENAAISTLLADGSGSLRLAHTAWFGPVGSGVLTRTAVDDFDGDGAVDVAIGGRTADLKPLIAFGDGTGQFDSTMSLEATSIVGSISLSVAPLPALLVVSDDEVQVIQVTAARNVTAARVMMLPPGARVLTVDADADGNSEIAVADDEGLELKQYRDGVWETMALVPAHGATDLVAIDIDSNTVPELIVTSSAGATVYQRNGIGYARVAGLSSFRSIVAAMISDVDGDGASDLILTSDRSTSGFIQVFRNDRDGGLTPYATSMTGARTRHSASVADLDGDAAPDVALPTSSTIELHRNRCMTARVRVSAPPRRIREGDRVDVTVHALSTDSFAIGPIRIRKGSAVVTSGQPNRANDFATITWTTPPLSKGTHEYTVEYNDQFAGTSTTTFTLNVGTSPRRRAVRP